ncbi:MAG: sigma-54-dependent Fis family transcriptional regulator, partial [Candidatus Latescibacteria bacterium]|nr:sigma-54-dependent Fis family transcriptional regulator [Candidatus Latescibacterota bacterium]
MNILLLSTDTEVISSVRDYTHHNNHLLTVASETDRAKPEIESRSYDAVLMDCSIRPSELIGFSSKTSDALTETVVLLIGPLDHSQREQLGKRLFAHYSIDKPLRGKAFSEVMHRVMMRSTIVRKANLIGRSTAMEETIQTIIQIGPTTINILITGESGSGKEVIARAIHTVSKRSDKPFLAVNCAALAKGVLESELFGHEKGSFTGANARRIGMFEKANNGIIFLDEIGEIPHSTQIMLLRVLEEQEIMRVGGTEIIPVDVRVIAATNRDLDELVERGDFRRDLYYRIKVLEINVPPLRKRSEDIPLFIDHIASNYAQTNNTPARRFDESTKSYLSQFPWPGNVRELRNFVESCLALTTNRIIRLEDIPEHLLSRQTNQSNLPVPAEIASDHAERELIFRTLLELKRDIGEIRDFLFEHSIPRHTAGAYPGVEVTPVESTTERTFEEMERLAIIDSLRLNNGNRKITAEMLGIGE